MPSGWRCSWPPHAVGVVGSGTGACTPHKHINTTPSRQRQVLGQAVVWRTVPGRSGLVGGLMRLVAAENGGGGWI